MPHTHYIHYTHCRHLLFAHLAGRDLSSHPYKPYSVYPPSFDSPSLPLPMVLLLLCPLGLFKQMISNPMSSRPTRNESRRESAWAAFSSSPSISSCLPPSLTAKCELFRAQSKVGKISEAKKNHNQVAKADLARPSAVFAYDLELNWSWKWRCSCSLSCLFGLGEACNISTRILDVFSHINHILLLLPGPGRATGIALLACCCSWGLSMQNSLLSTCANNNSNNNVAHCLLDFQFGFCSLAFFFGPSLLGK